MEWLPHPASIACAVSEISRKQVAPGAPGALVHTAHGAKGRGNIHIEIWHILAGVGCFFLQPAHLGCDVGGSEAWMSHKFGT